MRPRHLCFQDGKQVRIQTAATVLWQARNEIPARVMDTGWTPGKHLKVMESADWFTCFSQRSRLRRLTKQIKRGFPKFRCFVYQFFIAIFCFCAILGVIEIQLDIIQEKRGEGNCESFYLEASRRGWTQRETSSESNHESKWTLKHAESGQHVDRHSNIGGGHRIK